MLVSQKKVCRKIISKGVFWKQLAVAEGGSEEFAPQNFFGTANLKIFFEIVSS